MRSIGALRPVMPCRLPVKTGTPKELRYPPGIFACNRALRHIRMFKGLARHHIRGSGEVLLARPLGELLPKGIGFQDSLMGALDQGIGMYEDYRRASIWRKANPIGWLGFVLSIPVRALIEAGLISPERDEDTTMLKWILGLVQGAFANVQSAYPTPRSKPPPGGC